MLTQSEIKSIIHYLTEASYDDEYRIDHRETICTETWDKWQEQLRVRSAEREELIEQLALMLNQG